MAAIAAWWLEADAFLGLALATTATTLVILAASRDRRRRLMPWWMVLLGLLVVASFAQPEVRSLWS